jgi:hypothetical protein
VFSQVGRSTAFDIESLKSQLFLEGIDEAEESGAHADHDIPSKAVASKKSKSKASLKSGDSQEGTNPRTPGGDLAKAIHEKLSSVEVEVCRPVSASTTVPASTSAFTSQGTDGRWATKMGAMNDINAFGRRNETHPDPAWYKVKHDSVLHRPPAWNIGAGPKTKPRSTPPDGAIDTSMSFLTGIDISQSEHLTARQRAHAKMDLGITFEASEREKGSVMSLASGRGDLGKIGRNHVLGHETSCAYDSDLLEQDIKGYPKLRYPQWDFNAYAARKPLMSEDSLGEPGKYEPNLDSVKAVAKGNVELGKRLSRDQFVGLMGYIAPPAVLHPEDKRTRGLLPDRSTAKNSVRLRVTHVNDFDTELPRRPLLTGSAQIFHDENDPVASQAVYEREMSYVASIADIPATHRRDITVSYARMAGRGRDAVQGIRALSQDLGVRGAVGLGFVETKHQMEASVEQIEAREKRGGRDRPNMGPKLDNTTLNEHTFSSERLHRGKHPVRGAGIARKGPLKRNDHPILVNAFKRVASEPGFESRAKFGGTRILGKNRSFAPHPQWRDHSILDVEQVAEASAQNCA